MTDRDARLHNITRQLPSTVRLLAVSKTFDANAVHAVWEAGQRAFGENYVQEAVDKIRTLAHLQPAIEWHLIGPLQSNKTAIVAAYFDWVQTVDRFKIAQRLNAQRPEHLPPLNVCIQINVDGGANKSGLNCTDSLKPDGVGLQAALVLARQIGSLPRLVLRGLLAIPEPESDAIKQQAVFARIKAVFDFLNANLSADQQLDTLSMGMSADYGAAIQAGSTMVRIGSAILGERTLSA
jgi:PLP dependent protein